MEYEKTKALLEKYWQAETTVEEEQALAVYFRGGDVAAELEPYRSFFAYLEEEMKVVPGSDFEDRILARIGFPSELNSRSGEIRAASGGGDASVASGGDNSVGLGADHNPVGIGSLVRIGGLVRRRNFGYAAAAAVLLFICGLLLVVRLSNRQGTGEAPTAKGGGRLGQDTGGVLAGASSEPGRNDSALGVDEGASVGENSVKDTYEDPEKAMAAVRRALLIASVHLQEGRNITQKNMHRLNNSWQAATGQLQTATKNDYE